jgi:DNA repair protein REV1
VERLLLAAAPSAPAPAPHAASTATSAAATSAAAAHERVIVHLDMDCFFVSVAAVGRPEFAGRPLAVCHSNSARGTGEISSANYEARAFGVAAGMFMGEAKRRCPELIVVPYDFEAYERITEQARAFLYGTLLYGRGGTPLLRGAAAAPRLLTP